MAAILANLIGTTSVLGISLIPLLTIGLTLYRYNNLDPESHLQNAREVMKLRCAYGENFSWKSEPCLFT